MKKSIRNLLFIASFITLAMLGLNLFPVNISKQPESQTKVNLSKNSKPPVIGIVLPMEHTALSDMVAGFQDALKVAYPHPVIIQLQNAQGDIKLQRSILERFKGQKVDVVVTIGTSTSQMALSIMNTQPIVSLAAMLPQDEVNRRSDYLMGIQDEVGGEKKLSYLRKLFPKLKKMTILYHSGNEKNYPEIKEITQIAKALGMSIQTIAIQTLPELQIAASAIAADSELILILKDHLIVSGIKLICPIAESRKIPLVSSDEGSVKGGSAFALGVSERKIGEAGGKLVAEFLYGSPIKHLPRQSVQAPTIFYNEAAAERQHVSIANLQKAAKSQAYAFEAVK